MQESSQAQIGRFRISEKLGSGLHGAVYLGLDPQLERQVAIKVLRPERAAPRNDGTVPAEARILAKLRHPNIVPVFEAGMHEQAPYFVMEYVPGTTLRRLIDGDGPPTLDRAVALMTQTLAGMAHAHAQGIAHLDLSPGNILIDAHGVPRVMDFGLSRLLGVGHESTAALVGTPRYMTPEHFRFEALGPDTDVFALGLIFYELICGRPVSLEKDMQRHTALILEGEPDWAVLRAHGAGDGLEGILRTALARDRTRRYPDAGAMHTALALWREAGEATGEASTGTEHSTVQFLLRRMAHKREFPALSRNLVEINRLTGSGSNASAKRLAEVVMRDYAVSNKLLRLANSAYYANLSGSVTKVSEAVTLLGFPRVRAIANSLMYAGALQSGDPGVELMDALIASFLSGLIARHLAQRAGLRDIEDAFLCGMFRSLGKSLCICYLPDDYRDIVDLTRSGVSTAEAAGRVLGIEFSALGIAVAQHWRFPEAIINTMHPLILDAEAKRPDRDTLLHAAVAFAHELCELVSAPPVGEVEAALERVGTGYARILDFEPDQLRALLASALGKLREFAPALGVKVTDSPFVALADSWAEAPSADTPPPAPDVPVEPAPPPPPVARPEPVRAKRQGFLVRWMHRWRNRRRQALGA